MWIYKLERKIPWFKIPNLIPFVVIMSGLIYFFDLIAAVQHNNISLCSMLYFDRNLILSGQFWRVLSFIFVPPNYPIVLIFLQLYLVYFVGKSLESMWGDFKLTLYYFIGVVAFIIGGFIIGNVDASFLIFSLFFAFAITYPDLQALLFYVIPIKAMWFGILCALVFLFSLISSILVMNWVNVASACLSIVNFLIFLGPKFFSIIFTKLKYLNSRRKFMNRKK